MAINFVPQRGQILICDFEYGKIEQSLGKIRRSVVISPRSYNRRHGMGPGRCVVIPFSATPPQEITPACVEFESGIYRSLSQPTWALCDCIRSVSHSRLDRVGVGKEYLSEMISNEDMARIEVGLRHAVGLV